MIVRVCENECVAFNAPTSSSNVFRPIIKLPDAPTAVGMKNDDACGTDLAAVNPATNNELRIIGLRDCCNDGETDNREGEFSNERIPAPNELKLSHG